MLVALNFGAARVTVNLPGRGRIVATNREREGKIDGDDLALEPAEGVIVEL